MKRIRALMRGPRRNHLRAEAWCDEQRENLRALEGFKWDGTITHVDLGVVFFTEPIEFVSVPVSLGKSLP